MPEEYTHRVQMDRTTRDGGVIRCDAGLHYIEGNRLPYFYVTGMMWEGTDTEREPWTCGCIHEEVERYFPELVPVIPLHLAYINGIPMHAFLNGLYHLGHGKYAKLNLDHVASHFRITVDEARALHWKVRLAGLAAYRIWYGHQLSRWTREARETTALLQMLSHCGWVD